MRAEATVASAKESGSALSPLDEKRGHNLTWILRGMPTPDWVAEH